MKRFILIALVFFFWVHPVEAQLMVEQGKIFVNVQSQQTVADQLFVHNTSDQPIRVKANWEDFMYIEPFDGKKKFLPPGSTEHSLSGWIKFSPQEFELPPYSKQIVNYTIKVPVEAEGGYYGVLFFEQLTSPEQEFTGVRVITRVGTLFFIETVDKFKRAAVDGIAIADRTIRGRLFNQGDTILIPQGIHYVLDTQGLAVDRGELEKFYLPPKRDVDFHIDVSSELKPGRYSLILTFDLQEGDSLVKEVDFAKKGTQLQLLQVSD